MEDLLLFGGLAGMGVSLLLIIILIPVFRAKRRRLLKQIESGD